MADDKKNVFMTPSQVMPAFKSKADFANYFKNLLQLYVPPPAIMNKDFLKQVLAEEKKLLPLKNLKTVNVGHYPELAINKMYKEFAARPALKPYLPDTFPKGRQIDKTFFWNLVNSFYPEEVQSILEHCNIQRNGVPADEERK